MGKFIVFEGLDGSGKSSQVERLEEELKERGYSVKNIHFPRTQDDNAVFAGMINDYLNGKYGEGVSPYFIASLYANDRYIFKDTLEGWIEEYDYVIADRYMYSAMAFQGANFSDEENDIFITDRDRFFDWLWNYEFEQNKIPEPDLVIYVDILVDMVKKSLEEKDKDIHESDCEYLNKVRNTYRDIWYLHNEEVSIIKGFNQNKRYNVEEVSRRILNRLKERDLI
jgi:dTMP kinase